MYQQREPMKYGSSYQPRQSNSRRYKQPQRGFLTRQGDIFMVLFVLLGAALAAMWFISRLPILMEGASSFYDWATSWRVTWGTSSMWWLFVNLIVGAIVVSSGLLSAFGDSASDSHRKEYIEKGVDIAESPVTPSVSSSYLGDDSFEETAYLSYAKPAKPSVAYTPLQPGYVARGYSAEDDVTYDPAQEEVTPTGSGEEIHAREVPTSVYESLPVSVLADSLGIPAPTVSAEVAVDPELFSLSAEYHVEPKVVAAEPEREVTVDDQEKVRVVGEGSDKNDQPDEGGTREIEALSGPSSYDPFSTIEDPPSGYGTLQRNFTETAIQYIRADVPLISAPAPKAELVKAHTFTNGRAIRRDQIDSYFEPLARKLEEMKRRDEMNARRPYAEPGRTSRRTPSVDTPSRDTKPAKIHSRNSSVEVTSRDIQHSYPTEVFYPPPVQALPAEIAHYFSSAHQSPPAQEELRQVTPAPSVFMRAVSKRASLGDVQDGEPSNKISPPRAAERLPPKKTAVETLERLPSRKTSSAEAPGRAASKLSLPGEVADLPPPKQTAATEAFQRLPSRKTTPVEVPVEGLPRSLSKKAPSAFEALADRLKSSASRKVPSAERDLGDFPQRQPSKKALPSKQASLAEASEHVYSKQASQGEALQRPLSKQASSVQTPIQSAAPVNKASPPPSPRTSATLRKQVSPPPPPPAPRAEEGSPPTSPPMIRAMPPPPPPHLVGVKNPSSVTLSGETPSFNYYLPKEGGIPPPRQEGGLSAEVSVRSVKYATPGEDTRQGTAPEVFTVRSFRTDPGSSSVQRVRSIGKHEQSQKRKQGRPAEARTSAGAGLGSEITEEVKETDDLHQQIEDFLARMHEDMRLQRQESMARNKRVQVDFED